MSLPRLSFHAIGWFIFGSSTVVGHPYPNELLTEVAPYPALVTIFTRTLRNAWPHPRWRRTRSTRGSCGRGRTSRSTGFRLSRTKTFVTCVFTMLCRTISVGLNLEAIYILSALHLPPEFGVRSSHIDGEIILKKDFFFSVCLPVQIFCLQGQPRPVPRLSPLLEGVWGIPGGKAKWAPFWNFYCVSHISETSKWILLKI